LRGRAYLVPAQGILRDVGDSVGRQLVERSARKAWKRFTSDTEASALQKVGMKRTLSVVLVADLAAASVPLVAQEGMPPVAQPRFAQEAIRHVVSAATQDPALPSRLTSQRVTASGADTNHSWDTLVGTVKPGERVIVTLVNATNVEGELLSIDTRSIRVEPSGGPQTIEAADVVRVRYAGVRKRHVVYGMLIGVAAGALTAVVIDQHSSHPSTKVEAAAIGAIFFGLPAGAIGGAVVPIGRPLYERANVVRKTP
jgi:hypothetical protein